MDASTENKNKYIALALTIGVHALLFLLFLFMVFVTPIPPFEIKEVPEVMLDLGMEGLGRADAGGSGQNDTDIETSNNVVPSPAVNNNDATPIITDETETAVSVKNSSKTENVTKAVIPKIEEPKPSSELLNALAALKNKKKHTGKGEGNDNTGGSGTGNQHGVGGGDDTGHGNNSPGYNGKGGYDLKGRMLLKKPERMSDSEEGVVIVEIIVDENGKVIKATPGQRGSTTTSSNLYAKARQAALSAKFNASKDGKKEQRGSYTFVFILE